MRGPLIQELLDRAASDSEFRKQAVQDLEGTLSANGYELTEDELNAAREFQSRVKDLTDEQLENELGDVRPHGA
jgi:hypothetical protein